MNVAVVVVTMNDGYKIEEWISHHKGYIKDVYLHIIVDNKSKESYKSTVKKFFPKSKIIYRSGNGGTTAAYNDGIKFALSDPKVDAIFLIANDIKLERGAIKKLSNIILKNNCDMLAPIMLEKDSDIVSDYGDNIKKTLYLKPLCEGENLNDIPRNEYLFVEAVTGGVTLSTRKFYEKVGLQDEALFMYSDEVDMGLRAKKYGLNIAVTNKAVSWHQHINPPGSARRRHPFSAYLIGRNKVYLAYKHFGVMRVGYVFFAHLIIIVRGLTIGVIKMEKESVRYFSYMFLGVMNGLLKNMKENKYSFME